MDPMTLRDQTGIDVSQLTEEELRQLMELGVIPDQMKQAESELAMYDKQRSAAGPQMRTAGNVVVAANPLEHVASGINKYQGQQGFNKQKALLDELRNKQVGARTGYATGLFGTKNPMEYMP